MDEGLRCWRTGTAHGSVVATAYKMASGGAPESQIRSSDSEVGREYDITKAQTVIALENWLK